ncbi:MAG: sugar isomerase, partial [Planctomycetota bacterium]
MVPSPSQKHAPVGSQPVVTAFLVVGRKRPGFDPEWGKEIEAAAQRITGGDDFTAVWLAAKAVDDTTLRQAVDEARRLRCQAMVVLQPTMGDGRLAPILAQLWDRPLVFWATPERPTGLKVSSCSLVGTHVMATTVRQLGHAFELVYGDPDAPETARHLAESIRLAALAAGLRRSKIGLVGGHAPGFINMHADPGLLAESLGVQLHDFGLQEFFDL